MDATVSSYGIKRSFVESGLPKEEISPFFCHLTYYDLPIKFSSTSKNFISDIQEYHPAQWIEVGGQEQYEFVFIDYQQFFDLTFFEDADPEFHVFYQGQTKVCIQRDFIGWTFDGKKFFFITQLRIDDGYFNCMRWAIPGLLIKNRSLVLHSSCLATQDGEAYLFLGPSGAGKTTTVKNFPDEIILGDDMNVINVSSNEVSVQSGAIGGQLVYKNFDRKFKLKKMFWLKKNMPTSATAIPLEDARLKLLGSVANVFFGHESDQFIHQVIHEVDGLVNEVAMYELKLMMGDPIWDLIQDS